jgi:signal transduction histidine kinase
MNDITHNWRRLLPLFLATTVALAVCLFWLGWRVMDEDRNQQFTRAQEQRDQAADLAVSALQRVLAEAEERLASFSASDGEHPQEPGEGAVLLAFGQGVVFERSGTPLPYYPGLPNSATADDSLFADAEELLFQRNDLPGALKALQSMARNADPAVTAGVLLRIAWVEKNLGNSPQALDAFTRLGKLDNVGLDGIPAGLAARQGRALIFENTGRRDELEREAIAICEDLERGRWMLTRGIFENSYKQARQWLKSDRPPIDPDRFAIADAAQEIWEEWRALSNPAPNGRGRRTLQVRGEPITVLTRALADRQTALLMSPRYLQAAWLKGIPERTGGFAFAITDSDGKAVVGDANSLFSAQTVRAAPSTPWTVHAISKTSTSTLALSGQAKVLLAGIALMGVLAVAGGYVVNRAILGELRTARLQSDFVAAVSHEFRTPLTAIRQLAEMLAIGRVSSEERRQQFYDNLLRESERLHRLVEGLLNFGRMEAGQLQYHFESIHPEKFVRDIVADFEREVAGRGYRIELNGDNNGALPQIRADRESLTRAFWNLLDNAVKYSPENRTVWIELSEVGQRLAVRVRDRGVGIPAAEQKEIFRKFVRGAASKNASIQGTGVGLAMAQRIVAAHGGEISVESQPGEGSVFTVLLPAANS